MKGETIHSLFNIPVTKRDDDTNFLPLSGESLSNLQREFTLIDCLIIDEFSMLSQTMLGKIDSRLRQAKSNNNIFGGISIILIGDPAQLLPVCATSLYDDKLKTDLKIAGHLAYLKFEIVITLEAVMRQQNPFNDSQQAQFMELLPRLRDGTSTFEDWQLLLTRIPNVYNQTGNTRLIVLDYH
jgi:ATP-dependent exoDNAse (exonuclease V) alpha subunit